MIQLKDEIQDVKNIASNTIQSTFEREYNLNNLNQVTQDIADESNYFYIETQRINRSNYIFALIMCNITFCLIILLFCIKIFIF